MIRTLYFHKGKGIIYLSLIFILCICFESEAEILSYFDPFLQNDDYHIRSQIFIGNNTTSLKGLFNEFHGPFYSYSKTNITIEDTRIDFGRITHKNIYLGGFYVHEASILTSPAASKIIYLTKNHLKLEKNLKYDFDLKAEGIEGMGIILSSVKKRKGLDIGLSSYVLFPNNVQSSRISGIITAKSEKTYDFDADISYRFSHNYLYEQSVQKPSGFGVGTNFSVKYSNPDLHYRFLLLINDIYSRIFWKDLPYSNVKMTSNTKIVGDDGYTRYNPTIKGKEGYEDYTQKIDPKILLAFSKNIFNKYSLSISDERYMSKNLWSISTEKSLKNNNKLKLSYDFTFKSKGIKYKKDNFSIELKMDRFIHPGSVGLSILLKI